MNDLRELYQQTIMDHNRDPRNFRVIEDATCDADGMNPLCGDHIHVYAQVEDGMLMDLSFEGAGCAISKASASLMTSMLKGKSVEEAKEWFEKFTTVVTTKSTEEVDISEFGKLAALAGVREFPARVKCASLAWRTLDAALKGVESVTTE